MSERGTITHSNGGHLEEAHAMVERMADAKSWATSPPDVSSSVPPRGNVVSGPEHHRNLLASLREVSSVVARTLGPHGSQALIRDSMGAHFSTKDGYTVLKHLVFVQDMANMVLDHVRSVARTIVRKVGDGSSTAIVMSASLLESFLAADLPAKFPPGAVQMAMNASADAIAQLVLMQASAPDAAGLELVATVAANNDPEVGALIAKIYRDHGPLANVFVGLSSTEETTAVTEPGYRTPRGMAHDGFANRATSDGAAPTYCLLAKARVLIWGGVLSFQDFTQCIAPVMNQLFARGMTFTIVAQGYAPEVLEASVQFRRKSQAIGFLLVDHAMASRKSSARLGDLASVLGGKYVDPEAAPRPEDGSSLTDEQVASLISMLGSASSVRSTMTETIFVTGARCPDADSRAGEVEAQLARVDLGNHAESMTDELDELKARIRSLRGTEVKLLAGGNSEQEKQALSYLLDDAALAASAALRSGVVEGLGMTAIRALHDPESLLRIVYSVQGAITAKTRLDHKEAGDLAHLVAAATRRAYMTVFGLVLDNARVSGCIDVINQCVETGGSYDALARRFTPPGKPAAMNPAETDAEVLRGAMSIVAMLISSNQTLLTRPRAGNGHD